MSLVWNPLNLRQCVGSPILGELTGLLALGMLFWYVLIAYKWLESSRLASEEGKWLWRWLVAIFIVCAVAGYFSLILALFFPKVSVILRILALATQNVVCPLFWSYAASRRFVAVSSNEKIGMVLSSQNTEEMSDRELALLARSLIMNRFSR